MRKYLRILHKTISEVTIYERKGISGKREDSCGGDNGAVGGFVMRALGGYENHTDMGWRARAERCAPRQAGGSGAAVHGA